MISIACDCRLCFERPAEQSPLQDFDPVRHSVPARRRRRSLWLRSRNNLVHGRDVLSRRSVGHRRGRPQSGSRGSRIGRAAGRFHDLLPHHRADRGGEGLGDAEFDRIAAALATAVDLVHPGGVAADAEGVTQAVGGKVDGAGFGAAGEGGLGDGEEGGSEEGQGEEGGGEGGG